MRILLIKSRSLNSKVYSWTPPLGVLYLMAYLRDRMGADVRVLDLLHTHDPGKEIAETIRGFDPDLVGLSGLTCESLMLHHAAWIARSILPRIAIIAGGPYASSDPGTTLADRNIDAAVIGEGEETLLELARLIDEGGEDWKKPDTLGCVPGIGYRGLDGLVQFSPPRKPIEDLDSMPLPAWDGIDVQKFWKKPGMTSSGVRPYMPVFTSRGCPYRCTYCHNLFGSRFRSRSAQSVVDEMAELQKKFGVHDFEILDDSINLDRERFMAILNGLEERGLKPMLHFPNGVRTDRMDEEMIRLLRKVGVGEVSVAVETASPRLQKQTHKNLDLDKVWRNIELMADLRIFTKGFFMMGYPTETEEELQSTIDFAVKSRLHLASFHVTNPFPGTAIHQEFKALGKLREDINPIDYEYVGAPFNGSNIPDKRFHQMFRQAYFRFYFRPTRIVRILRDRPYATGYISSLTSLLTKFVGFKRIRESL